MSISGLDWFFATLSLGAVGVIWLDAIVEPHEIRNGRLVAGGDCEGWAPKVLFFASIAFAGRVIPLESPLACWPLAVLTGFVVMAFVAGLANVISFLFLNIRHKLTVPCMPN